MPLDGVSPDSLHGQRDVGGDGVRQGQVEHQVVNIGAALQVLPGRLIFKHNYEATFLEYACLSVLKCLMVLETERSTHLIDWRPAMTRTVLFRIIPTEKHTRIIPTEKHTRVV